MIDNWFKEMLLSFVVPTYNRKSLIEETLDSIFETKLDIGYEVIIVDDCSSDDTQMLIEAKYKEQIGNGLLKYSYLENNLGVTGAKNYGVSIAKGKWIVFLDSDDLFIKESKYDFLKELSNNENCGVLFFRCQTFDGNLLGKEFEENVYYDLDKYMTLGFPGECLPVVKKEVALKFPYEQKLRGFEHIAYFRMLKNNVTILVSRVIARKYRTDNEDRLSNFKGKMKRAKQFYDGYAIDIQEYRLIKMKIPFMLRMKQLKYLVLYYMKILIKKEKNEQINK